jgi:hypothetical protein
MKISLSNGTLVEIDECDFELVKGYRWREQKSKNTSYAVHHYWANGTTKALLMHRMILGLTDPSVVTDHVNGNGLDNRRINLRKASHAENMRNSKVRAHSSSGIKGVMLENPGRGEKKKWRGTVRLNGKRYRKWFISKDDAEKWCIEMRKSLHGCFAVDARPAEATL